MLLHKLLTSAQVSLWYPGLSMNRQKIPKLIVQRVIVRIAASRRAEVTSAAAVLDTLIAHATHSQKGAKNSTHLSQNNHSQGSSEAAVSGSEAENRERRRRASVSGATPFLISHNPKCASFSYSS